MPIPTGPENPAPRRLLRDVVFDKMLSAIEDGTLQPGERLNDDELVTWLGVSRTPIREAIAKLVDYGLVEMEANRYTRIAMPDFDLYRHALQVYAGLNELTARWAIPLLSDSDVDEFTALVDTALRRLDASDVGGLGDFQAVPAYLRTKVGNPLLDSAERLVNARVMFMSKPVLNHWQWELTTDFLNRIREAVRRRDIDLAIAAFIPLNEANLRHLEAVEVDGALLSTPS
ncbi:GntR family transcriptional regulator [Frigoribacterium faeni]|uniref:GntR family transcriptional regulator n=1 Tax=Frigoribacterium faeni TaxID=145483 RepID=UPI001FACC0E8|nr:GntR family transcriptional regulator [Frigoribacterium faeni]MCJ0701075.1 GntR family transcriptional regulator [Frigoribacterium faeni]